MQSTSDHERRGLLSEQAWKVISVFVPLVAVVALPVVALQDQGESGAALSEATAMAQDVKEPAFDVDEFLSAVPEVDTKVENPAANQLSYLNLDTGQHIGSPSERFEWASLSLSKLYIAHYVFKHGTAGEKLWAEKMVRSSSDMLADRLYKKHPKAIASIAKEYNLGSTRADDSRWGYSLTSAFDAMSFVAQLVENEPDAEVLEAMRDAYPFAADRTRQNYGTFNLFGEEGTKWGWSDDDSLHSSVSFGQLANGERYVVAAMVTGSPMDLTTYVQQHLGDVVGMDDAKVAKQKKSTKK